MGFSSAVLSQTQQLIDEDKNAGVTPRPLSDVCALVAEIARTVPRHRES